MNFSANRLTSLEDRAAGALLGLAIGDALGAPWEFMDAVEVRRQNPHGVVAYASGGVSGLGPGQGTDDTELALLTAESLLAHRAVNMADIAARLLEWGQRQLTLGPSTGAGLKALADGVPPHLAGSRASASSGCLPRCAPLALAYRGGELDALSQTCSLPTHRHPLAIAAVVSQNRILAALIDGHSWQQALAALHLPLMTSEPVELEPLRQALQGNFAEPGAVDVLAEAADCVASASDPAEALSAAVLLGGDTDTRAAAAGALAGARWGAAAFPTGLVEPCEQAAFCLQAARALVRLAETQKNE